MALTAEQAERVCGDIEGDVRAFEANARDLEALRRALRGMDWLRRRYHENEQALAPVVDRLRDCRRRLQEVIRAASVALTAEYLQASRALTACRRRREACREALVELVRSDGVGRFECPDGALDVRQFRTMMLPRPDSPEREELCRILSECDRWEAAAVPSGARLLQAIEDGAFPAEQAERIAALCSVRESIRLSPHRPT